MIPQSLKTIENIPISFILPDGMKLGGGNAWSLEMTQRLNTATYPVSILEHVNTEVAYDGPLPLNIKYIRCHNSSPLRVTVPEIFKHYLPFYQQLLPSVIIPNWYPGTYAACAVLSLERADEFRVIAYCHTDAEYYYQWLTYYEPIIHSFVAVSQEIAETLARRIPHRSHDIHMRLYPINVPPALVRKKPPATAPLRLVYAGRLQEEQKRISDLIRLIQWLEKKCVNFEFQIVGEGEQQRDFRRMVEALAPEIRSRIDIKGRVPYQEMPQIWFSSDVCILVSEYEGTSISMCEAMAHGCMPLVTKVSGTSALISSGWNGYVCNIGDMEGMATILQQLDHQREKIQTLQRNAHQTMAEMCSYQEYIQWFLELAERTWDAPPRKWPLEKPLLCHAAEVTEQDLSAMRPVQKFVGGVLKTKAWQKLQHFTKTFSTHKQ